MLSAGALGVTRTVDIKCGMCKLKRSGKTHAQSHACSTQGRRARHVSAAAFCSAFWTRADGHLRRGGAPGAAPGPPLLSASSGSPPTS
eukprot:1036894-Pleurochrysis_carterae.AAC.2